MKFVLIACIGAGVLGVACSGSGTDGITTSGTCNVDQRRLSGGGTITALDATVNLSADKDYENVVFRLELLMPDGSVIDQHESSFSGVTAGRSYSQRINLDATAVPDDVDFDALECQTTVTETNADNPPIEDGLPF